MNGTSLKPLKLLNGTLYRAAFTSPRREPRCAFSIQSTSSTILAMTLCSLFL